MEDARNQINEAIRKNALQKQPEEPTEQPATPQVDLRLM